MYGPDRSEIAAEMARNDGYEDVYQQLLEGKRLVVSTEFLDYADHFHDGHEIRTCINSKQLGMRDEYVAWVQESAQPPNLKFESDGMTYGSVD